MNPKDKDATIARLTAERDDWKARYFRMRDERDKAQIASANYASFNHEWRQRAEAAEAKLAEVLAERDHHNAFASFLSGEYDTVLAGRNDEFDRAEAAENKLADAEARGFALLDENARLNAALLVLGAYLMEKGEAFRVGDGAELLDAYHAALSPVPQADPVRGAAQVLLDDDISLSKMAEAVHDGPLGADDHRFSAATKQGAWCLDVVRAALRALAQKGGE